MRLVPAPKTGLAVGRPLPFALRDTHGRLLLAKGVVLPSDKHIQALEIKGVWVSADEADVFLRSFTSQLGQMVHRQSRLGAIADAQPESTIGNADVAPVRDDPEDWARLLQRTNSLLRDPARAEFLGRLERLRDDLRGHLQRSPDATLLTLIYSAGQDYQLYAASHALLVASLCELAGKFVPHWDSQERDALCMAALTMNLSMAALQNQLATQADAPDATQRAMIQGHAAESVRILRDLGVADDLWLESVARHHEAEPGSLATRPIGGQLARLIQRADLYAARLSRRRKRNALSAAAAAQVAYLDENKQPDEAGTALIKVTGMHPPGALVQLASNELGIVLRRGDLAGKPVVAAVVGKSGIPLGDPIMRRTSDPTFGIARSIAPHEMKLRVTLEALLKLG